MQSRNIFITLALAASMAAGAQVYNNPVIDRSLPDPTVMRGDDGKFYLFATEDTHNVPVMKSEDLVHWNYLTTAFRDNTRPNFVQGGAIWAPDVNYINGQYVLYYSMSTWGGSWTCGIGYATAKKIWGPYTKATKMFISSEIGIENCIDPFFFQDDDGKNYLFWGSFHDIYGQELTEDGLAFAEGSSPKKIAGGLIEATYIIKHDGYYYLIGSAGSCCEGANSTYRLVMTRARKIMGPYVDRNGRSATGDNFSELLHKSQKVVGPGHCSEWIKDDNGDYWVMYHGFELADIDGGRKVYLDKVEWDDKGWPTIKDSQPSEESAVPFFDPTSVKGVTKELSYTVDQADSYRLLVSSPDNTPFSWQIVASNGKICKSGNASQSLNVWTTDLPHGIYVVKVSGRHGAITEKIVL